MLFIVILLYFGGIPVADAQTYNRCYACATNSLKRRWHLTQLRPAKTVRFDNPGQSQNNWECGNLNNEDLYLVNCTSPCMTLAFRDPDATMDVLYVKGCHSELTGAQLSSGSVNKEVCEYDSTWTSFKCDGTSTTTEANFVMCTGDKCNNQKGIDTTPRCASTTTNEVQCFDCEKVNDECRSKKNDPSARKTKKYCTKTHAKLDGTNTYYVTQSNSDINLYYSPNYCSAARQSVTPIGGLTVAHAQVVDCVCNDRDRCNSAHGPRFAFVISAIFFAVIAQFWIWK